MLNRLSLKSTALILALAVPISGQAFETAATSAYVLDQTTGTVLLEKQADIPLPPASMSKLMTLNMLFEALKDGRVTMETRFPVSSKAKAMGGSTMFLNERDRPTVEELILGIIVQSGNDACVVVAEGLAGSEATFAAQMTTRAKALGMNDSSFANASGWPHPGQRMSMHDLGVLAERLINEFPEYYPFFAQTEFPFDGRSPDNRFNRNPLLKLGIGADGLKTGHTQEAGYGLVGSAKQGSRRVTFVISGLTSEKARAEEAERVVSWAFRQFVEKTVAKGNTQIATAPVWMGNETTVGLVAAGDAILLVPALSHGDLKAEVRYKSPLQAPISKGQEIATLVIALEGMQDAEIPLVADRDITRGGFLPRLKAAAQVLFKQVTSEAQAAE